MKKPAMMAVNKPASGLSPDAMAKAMAKGKATTPTVMPAAMSAPNCSREYPCNESTSLGRKKKAI
jgi:hypothetical protein